eukprot:CAMPEP_0168617656 /NCGR_PEP_ID=MMETSP0449_2-20121227/5658_1 /TAXON_ID=1082188 /ORGANISM="Strombidium rassoulzadegani, Strain ras09" /LENGTH=242 /DNA_ID=CAMNT_0008658485 /DNA_START=306 /DNA_END=1033 /DNA_ORIENTATION=-
MQGFFQAAIGEGEALHHVEGDYAEGKQAFQGVECGVLRVGEYLDDIEEGSQDGGDRANNYPKVAEADLGEVVDLLEHGVEASRVTFFDDSRGVEQVLDLAFDVRLGHRGHDHDAQVSHGHLTEVAAGESLHQQHAYQEYLALSQSKAESAGSQHPRVVLLPVGGEEGAHQSSCVDEEGWRWENPQDLEGSPDGDDGAPGVAAVVKQLAERGSRARPPRLLAVNGVEGLVGEDGEGCEEVAER